MDGTRKPYEGPEKYIFIDSAFEDCVCLTAVTIPGSVTAIGNFAFAHCGSLTAVTIPDSVREIGSCAFVDCLKLDRVEIPAGADVHPDAFGKNTEVIRRG